MKRVILLTGIMMLVAANGFAMGATVTYNHPGFSKSKGVIVGYASGTSAGATCTGATCVHFAASAKNTAGDKIYGAVDTNSSVWMKTDTAGDELVAADNPSLPTATDSTPGSGWTAM